MARGWQELSLRCPVPPVWCNHLFVLGTGVTCAMGWLSEEKPGCGELGVPNKGSVAFP